MVRMTDLLKKAQQKMETKRGAPSSYTAKNHTSLKGKPAEDRSVEFSQMLLGRTKGGALKKEDIAQKVMEVSLPNEEETKKLYLACVDGIKNIFEAYKKGDKLNKDEIVNIGRKIVNDIISGSQLLLRLLHELDSLELYRYYNAVNVSILSVEIGISFKYNKSELLDLAIVGLLHDLDLIKNQDITDKSDKLSKEELEEIKKHPLNAAIFVDNAFKFSEAMVSAILQHHEREDGQGYPSGLGEEEIHDFALIIGIADTYESMIHSRPHKEKLPPDKAILNMIDFGKDLFANTTVKALVSRVGLYPVGSWIELSTGEIGRVVMVNPDSPLRPVVSILKDKNQDTLKEVMTVDLEKIPSLYIKHIAEAA